MQRKKFKAGEVVFKEGDHSREAYRILSGRIEISLRAGPERVTLAQMGPGEIFGEMSMIDDKPRSANACALKPSEVEIVTPDEFNTMVYHDPEQLVPYLKSFFERLRRTNEHLGSLASHVTDQPESEHVSERDEVRLKAANSATQQRVAKSDLPVHKFPFRIGRWSENPQADVFVSNDYLIRDQPPFQISRNHCAIEQEGNRYYVLDRGSTYGTGVNDQRIGGTENQMVMPLRQGKNDLQLGGKSSPYCFEVWIP